MRIVVLIFILLTTSLQAQFGRGSRGNMHNWEEELHLSEEQIIQRQTIRNEYYTSRNALIDSIQDRKMELRMLLDKQDQSTGNIKFVYNQISDMEQSLETLWLHHRHAIREILNEDQRTIFDSYMHGNGRMLRGQNNRMFRGGNDGMNNNKHRNQ